MLEIKKVKEVRKELTRITDELASVYSTDEVVYEVMAKRKYMTEEMYNTLKEMQIFKLKSVTSLLDYVKHEHFMDFGIVAEGYNFLLGDRYILPIRTFDRSVTAWVGWFPDVKKYITSTTYGFDRSIIFFNADDALKKAVELPSGVEKYIFFFEGIFDTVLMRSLGQPALGNMGLPLSFYKRNALNYFGNVIKVSDNDRAGRSTQRTFDGYQSKNAWNFSGVNQCQIILPAGMKDFDDAFKLGRITKESIERFLSCKGFKEATGNLHSVAVENVNQ